MGLFSFMKKAKEPELPPIKYGRTSAVCPKKIGESTIAYQYVFKIDPNDYLLRSGEEFGWQLEASEEGDHFNLILGDTPVAALPEKHTRMLHDWKRRGRIYRIYVTVTSEENETCVIAFYMDKKKEYANREQTVEKLVSFKSRSAQSAIECMEPGDELSIEDGEVYDVNSGELIGKLTSKAYKKLEDEGGKAAFLERIDVEETEDYESILIPFIRIYW